DGGDPTVLDADVGAIAGKTGAVDDRAVLDHQVVRHSLAPLASLRGTAGRVWAQSYYTGGALILWALQGGTPWGCWTARGRWSRAGGRGSGGRCRSGWPRRGRPSWSTTMA